MATKKKPDAAADAPATTEAAAPAGDATAAPGVPQDDVGDEPAPDSTGTEDAEAAALQATKDAALDAALEQITTTEAAAPVEVIYYRTERRARFVKDSIISDLPANTLVTSLTHNTDEMRRQGVPLIKVRDEHEYLDLTGDQPAHRHHGVV